MDIFYHELTHVIDRHDINFTGGISPPQLSKKIEKLPHIEEETRIKSVHKPFRALWDAYIDGRLERRNIIVTSFEIRLEEIIGGNRLKKGLFEESEVNAIKNIWETEPHTFKELVEIATAYPYMRKI